MGKSGLPEERKIPNRRDVEQMALIKIGTGTVCTRIVGIDERAVITVGGVVNRVAIGVSRGQVQLANTLASRNLKSVVNGGRVVLQPSNVVQTVIGPIGIGRIAASGLQVNRGLPHNWLAVDDSGDRRQANIGQTGAVRSADLLTRSIRIGGCGRRLQLVQVELTPQERSFAAHIGNRHNRMTAQFMLDIEVPLLHARPDDPLRNRVEAEWERWSGRTAADVVKASDIILRLRLQQRRGLTFHAFCIGFVAVTVLEEDAIAATNGSLPVAERIIGKTNARRGIEQVTTDAARVRISSDLCRVAQEAEGPARPAALFQPQEWIAHARNQSAG